MAFRTTNNEALEELHSFTFLAALSGLKGELESAKELVDFINRPEIVQTTLFAVKNSTPESNNLLPSFTPK